MGSSKRMAAVAALIVLAQALAACGGDSSSSGGGSQPAAKTGGTPAGQDQSITVASGAEAESLDPQSKDDDGMMLVTWRIYEGLYDFDVDGELVPLLAEGMPEAIDDTTARIKLKPDVTFSDGQPFDAKAAVASIERIIDPKFATGFSETATLKSAKAIDDHTIEITTKGPDGLLANRLAVVKMLPAKLPDGFPQKTVGTGPYVLDSYQAGGNAVLKANPKYRGEKPQITTVQIKNIPDEGTRLQALKTGEVDVVPGLSPDQAADSPNSATSRKAVYVGLLRPNTIKGVMSDQRVRQALSMAVDREAIAKTLFEGNAIPSSCQPNPVHVGDPSLKELPFDVDKAKQLVQQAGAAGKTVNVTWTTGVFPQDRVVGQAVAQNMEATGVKVNLKLKNYKAFLEDIYARGEKATDLVFTEADNNLGSAAGKVILFYPSDGPVSTVDDPEMDALFKVATAETDPDKRDAAFNKTLQRGCEQVDLLTLYERKELFGLSERVEFEPNPVAYSKIYYDQMKVVNPQ